MNKVSQISIENQVISLPGRTSRAEKIGQMAQVDIRGISPQALAMHSIGSVMTTLCFRLGMVYR